MKIEWGDLEDFLRYTKSPPLSSNTIADIRRTFKRVSPFIDQNGLSSKTMLSYIKLKRNEGLLNKSLNRYVKFFIVLDLYLKTDYSKIVQIMPEEDTEFDVITKEEKEAIIACEQVSDKATVYFDKHLYSVLFLLLSEMALRCSEALSLTWDSYKDTYITVRSTKTNRVDDILITPRLQKELQGLKRSGEYIFPMSHQKVNLELTRRVRELKINKKVSTHTFRRSFATVGLEDGIHQQFIQEKGRWRNANSMDKYVRKSKRHQRVVLQQHSFTVDSMSQEDKVNYIRGKQRELEDEMRRLGVSESMLVPIIDH